MRILNMNLATCTYPIRIGSDLLKESELSTFVSGRQVLIVTNETVAPLYLIHVQRALAVFETAVVVLPDGERHKTMQVLDLIHTEALRRNFSRNATFIALGGGVVGDMAGFAAATYQRGVPFVQIPTTLLAQVDSSVGGKTGVNHPLGKNMIGAFHQPVGVLIDTSVLQTLPARELSAGLAEVIKYGLLGDVEFLAWIESNIDQLISGSIDVLEHAIFHSCRMKAEIVAQDEREGSVRALLNLGHTFGHAIEAYVGFGNWLHGDAVSVGMVMAARFSCYLGHLSESDVERVRYLCLSAGLPVDPPKKMTPVDFLTYMAADKKNIDGQMRLVLLYKLGNAYIEPEVSQSDLMELLIACCN
ncbi:3-dehydroquinate synthase [Litorivicinus sp.]|nr:3-dehydroquinate synthase [Litorivicinus sp.]MDC1208308.1 3-dehydroquinate synthase [Litorivicinus sp.]MDC1319232.1 3-dehydroquinate synthase [Litorivicinus sp.]